MCYPLFAAAFCAVFVPVPAHTDTSPAAAQARPAAPELTAIPAGRGADEAAPISLDVPGGRRGEALPDEAPRSAAARTRVAALALTARAAYASRGDTEAKSSSPDESGAADDAEAGGTEKK
jgi:hypothetical protein